MLGKKREALIKSFTTAANSGKQKRMSTLFVRICQTNQFLASLEQIANSKPELTSGKRRYAVSSLFLHESFKKLTADRDEEFFFITGNDMEFLLYQPSAEIQQHSHWVCFQHQGKDWYFVHMGKRPADVSSGI